MEVTLTVSNDPQLDGTYKSSGVATKCGLADYGYPSNGGRQQYPQDRWHGKPWDQGPAGDDDRVPPPTMIR